MYCSVIREREVQGGREKEGEEGRREDREERGGRETNGHCLLHFAILVGISLEGQTTIGSRVQGLGPFPSLSLPQEGEALWHPMFL